MTDDSFLEMTHEIYWNRNPEGIKSDFGKARLIGSSASYPNAILISSQFAQLSGNAYNALSLPEEERVIAAIRRPENQIFAPSLEELQSRTNTELEDALNPYECVLFGNGIAVNRKNKDLLLSILLSYKGNLVIDASGIELFGKLLNLGKLEFTPKQILLTPHLGEAKRLFRLDISSRNPMDYKDAAQEFAKEYGVSFLLKSYSSLYISDKKILKSADFPCAVLGKAGSGDGLAGYLTGLRSYLTKSYPAETIVLYADERIHRAALKAGEALSPGFGSILNLPSFISEAIISAK